MCASMVDNPVFDGWD